MATIYDGFHLFKHLYTISTSLTNNRVQTKSCILSLNLELLNLPFAVIELFQKTKSSVLQWNEIYCFQKILPLLTLWQLQNTAVTSNSQIITDLLKPKIIKKKRVVKGVPSYEIIWDQTNSVFEDLIPQDQINRWLEDEENSIELLYSTVEPQELVDKKYPQLVEEFLIRTKKPDKPKKKKRDKNIAVTPRAKKKTKTKHKENINPDKNVQQKKILDFIKPIENNYDESFCDILSDSEFNMSDIIKDIVQKSPAIKTLHGRVLRYDKVQTSSPLAIHNSPSISLQFKNDNNDNDEDILEISMNSLSLNEKLVDKNDNKATKSKDNLRSQILKKSINQTLSDNANPIDILSDSLNNMRFSFIDELCSEAIKADNCLDETNDKSKEASAICIDDSFGLVDYVPITKNFKKQLF